MANITKTQAQEIIALQTCASGAVVKGVIDTANKLTMAIGIHIGRTVATALTNSVKVRVEWSPKSSGDGFWFDCANFISEVAVSSTTATLTTGTTAGTATLPMTATAGIVIGDKVYIREAGAETNSEFGRVITVNANTNIIIEDNTLFNHTITTTKIWSKAEFFTCDIDLTGKVRIRVVVDCASALSGQTVVCEAWAITGDSIG